MKDESIFVGKVFVLCRIVTVITISCFDLVKKRTDHSHQPTITAQSSLNILRCGILHSRNLHAHFDE